MTPKILPLALVIISSLVLSGCGPQTSTDQNNLIISPTGNQPTTMTTPSSSPSQSSADTVVSLKTKYGPMLIKLYADKTPNTVKTFINKVNSGFYNGLSFHRVIAGFMAQGGDPTGTGMGGGRQTSELNNLPFKRGSLGLARTADSKEVSNDSQFFICFTTEGCAHLTNDYVNFGEVISGLDVLDQVKQGDKILEITTATK